MDHGFANAYLTIIGTSFFAAQTRATTHPIIVHPKKKFRRRMEVVSRLLRAKAMIVGRKYSRNPKPKMGKKNTAKRCMFIPPCFS